MRKTSLCLLSGILFICLFFENISKGFASSNRHEKEEDITLSNNSFAYLYYKRTDNNKGVDFIHLTSGQNRTEWLLHPSFSNFDYTDNFDLKEQDPKWRTRIIPTCELYSLTDKSCFSSLKCIVPDAFEPKSLPYVYYRIADQKFEFLSMIYFTPEGEKMDADILLFNDKFHQYFLSVGKLGLNQKIILNEVIQYDYEIIANQIIEPPMPIQLSVVSKGPNDVWAKGK